MKKVLPNLINNDQTGFLIGRSIGKNVRLIDSIITYAESQNIPGILLFIDFEKAFDTLEWNFIEKTLRYYNFGDSLITWIKLFYNDISSCIQMLDLQSFNRALKGKWIQRYLDPHNKGKGKLFVEFSLTGHDINLLLQGNLNSDDVASLGIEEPFTKELIETRSLLNFKKQLSNFGETPVW